MLRWRTNIESTKRRIEPMVQMLRNYTWNDMAREIVEFVESPGDFESATELSHVIYQKALPVE
jgi:hypothetical protein